MSCSSGRGSVATAQLFQRATRPRYTPNAVASETVVTNVQPTAGPSRRSTSSCTSASEATPSSRPSTATTPNRTASKASRCGFCEPIARCTGSVTRYGAFGRNASQNTPTASSAPSDQPRRSITRIARAAAYGSQARNRFQKRNVWPAWPSAARSPSRRQTRTVSPASAGNDRTALRTRDDMHPIYVR